MSRFIKSLSLFAVCVAASLQLAGCSTTTALLECGAEAMNPTVMAAVDSFESAGMAIKLSNVVLLETPLSEQDEWPLQLFGTMDVKSMAKMGVALAGSTQGVTVPLEIDPETGFPRPTSALYIYLKEREKMLLGLNNKDDIKFFKGQKVSVIKRDPPKGRTIKEGTIDKNIYRNPLMAYGVVTANNNALLEMQQEVENTANGYKTCNYFVYSSKEEVKDEAIKKKACPDPSMKDETIKAKLATKIGEKHEEKAQAEKAYGKLANKVYKASIAGADFSAAATTKLICAIINGVRALPNINNEFKGLKGAYNTAMILPRVKNLIGSLGMYKDNIGFQWTVYKTMYQQIKGTYEIKDDEPTKQALQRINAVEVALAEMEPKLALAVAGAPVQFSDAELVRMNVLAAMFPTEKELEHTLFAALK